MRVRVVISTTFTDEERLAINARDGKKGLATRKTIEELIRTHGTWPDTWWDIMEEGRAILEKDAGNRDR